MKTRRPMTHPRNPQNEMMTQAFYHDPVYEWTHTIPECHCCVKLAIRERRHTKGMYKITIEEREMGHRDWCHRLAHYLSSIQFMYETFDTIELSQWTKEFPF